MPEQTKDTGNKGPPSQTLPTTPAPSSTTIPLDAHLAMFMLATPMQKTSDPEQLRDKAAQEAFKVLIRYMAGG